MREAARFAELIALTTRRCSNVLGCLVSLRSE